MEGDREAAGIRVNRRDTTKGPPLRILSLDGGGVRGYSMLIIVQELMHCIFVQKEGRAPRTHEIPKPADHFDLIVGTGTGGLIALMLGRLRLDLETCKELYVRLTRHVFQTDKTIAGIPYRSTLYKASKLEQAIMDAVAEHTVHESEGNDYSPPGRKASLATPPPSSSSSSTSPRRVQRYPSNASVVSFSARSPRSQMAWPVGVSRNGNPDALLYDERPNRTKTAITAVYKGSRYGTPPALLRSYDSRREPAPEFYCKIWEAGRATCAVGIAFKPIKIGQTIFHDDGAGPFNPSPQALDEAVLNEWPGRDVGAFISIGTGKRPRSSDANQHQWYDDFMTGLADARKSMIAKLEGCEKTHEYMQREHLSLRKINPEVYYRFNVEVGVGEFGMNEWFRLGEISTGTRQYLSRDIERNKMQSASIRMARISNALRRQQQKAQRQQPDLYGANPTLSPVEYSTSDFPLTAAELPADVPLQYMHTTPNTAMIPPAGSPSVPPLNSPPPRMSYDEGGQEFVTTPEQPPIRTAQTGKPLPPEPSRIIVTAPTPQPVLSQPHAVPDRLAHDSSQPRPHTSPTPPPAAGSASTTTPYHHRPSLSTSSNPNQSGDPAVNGWSSHPPPSSSSSANGPRRFVLPYPVDEDEESPPPTVNMARKPKFNEW